MDTDFAKGWSQAVHYDCGMWWRQNDALCVQVIKKWNDGESAAVIKSDICAEFSEAACLNLLGEVTVFSLTRGVVE